MCFVCVYSVCCGHYDVFDGAFPHLWTREPNGHEPLPYCECLELLDFEQADERKVLLRRELCHLCSNGNKADSLASSFWKRRVDDDSFEGKIVFLTTKGKMDPFVTLKEPQIKRFIQECRRALELAGQAEAIMRSPEDLFVLKKAVEHLEFHKHLLEDKEFWAKRLNLYPLRSPTEYGYSYIPKIIQDDNHEDNAAFLGSSGGEKRKRKRGAEDDMTENRILKRRMVERNYEEDDSGVYLSSSETSECSFGSSSADSDSDSSSGSSTSSGYSSEMDINDEEETEDIGEGNDTNVEDGEIKEPQDDHEFDPEGNEFDKRLSEIFASNEVNEFISSDEIHCKEGETAHGGDAVNATAPEQVSTIDCTMNEEQNTTSTFNTYERDKIIVIRINDPSDEAAQQAKRLEKVVLEEEQAQEDHDILRPIAKISVNTSDSLLPSLKRIHDEDEDPILQERLKRFRACNCSFNIVTWGKGSGTAD